MPNSDERPMVIVGAGIAGTAAAVALRENGWAGRIVLLGDETGLPYERPPLSKSGLIDDPDPGPKHLVSTQQLDDLGITYKPGRSAETLSRPEKTLRLCHGGEVPY